MKIHHKSFHFVENKRKIIKKSFKISLKQINISVIKKQDENEFNKLQSYFVLIIFARVM